MSSIFCAFSGLTKASLFTKVISIIVYDNTSFFCALC